MFFRDFFGVAQTAAGFHFRRFQIHWILVLMLGGMLGGGFYALLAPPALFPAGRIVVVSRGENAGEAAAALARNHIVAHPLLLRLLLSAAGQGGNVRAGAYRFVAPENLLTITERLVSGDFGIAPQRIVFTEGETARQMAAKIAADFPEISASDFIATAEPYEGYLFPDTYSFAPDANAADMVAAMRANFSTRIAPVASAAATSGHSLSDLVILASIVEKEANNPADMKIVAGILWNRIRLGMPLQVDAVFGYINVRSTYAPSLGDLSVDSPYNTYTHTGLPPGPISNPGIAALTAAIDSATTNYLYYLTGKDGRMHYAATFAGHKANRAKYLN